MSYYFCLSLFWNSDATICWTIEAVHSSYLMYRLVTYSSDSTSQSWIHSAISEETVLDDFSYSKSLRHIKLGRTLRSSLLPPSSVTRFCHIDRPASTFRSYGIQNLMKKLNVSIRFLNKFSIKKWLTIPLASSLFISGSAYVNIGDSYGKMTGLTWLLSSSSSKNDSHSSFACLRIL